MNSRWTTFCLVAAGLLPVSSASAQRKKRRGKVIELEALKVEGRVQKPEAFYILQRSDLNFKGLEPKKSFIPMILKSVEREPF